MGGHAGPQAMKVAVHTLGCRVNQYDTEAMLEQLIDAGYEPVDFREKADVYIVNTCTVTAESDRKSSQLIRRAAAANPGALIVAAGCLSQRLPRQVAAMEGVDLVVGNQDRGRMAELVERARAQKTVAVSKMDVRDYEELSIRSRGRHVRANVKIQEGCDCHCTYCVIPSVRGPGRSRPLERVRQECRALADAGCPEIVLTGINLSSYGRDLAEPITLADAVEAAAGAMGRGRVRLGSLDPEVITGDFLDRIMGCGPRVCPQFHVALQSGCDATLRRMGRRYTTGDYGGKVALIRDKMPGAAVTTDIIAGFPGETEADFDATARFVGEMAFSRIHVFPYSDRPGTAASRLQGHLTNRQKMDRVTRLCRIGGELERAYAASLVGRTLEVLFEEAPDDGRVAGYSAEFVRVRAEGSGELVGTLAAVRILEQCDGGLAGCVVEK